jgi:FKBP-type peptidyl-prolyl cis-trans isomerase
VTGPNDPNYKVMVTGAFGKSPTITIPKQKAGGDVVIKTLFTGTGPALTTSDALLSNFQLYFWDGSASAEKGNTFGSTPQIIGTANLLTGLKTALIGKPIGSRVLAVLPPKDGFGVAGNTANGIPANTTAVFVFDLVKAYPGATGVTGTQSTNGGGSLPTVTTQAGSAPSVAIPKSGKAPTSLQVVTLIKGSGPKIVTGHNVVVQYVGVNWRTGQSFDSSWSRATPFIYTVGAVPEQVIPGWDLALPGKTVGSRLLVVIPPKDGYGSSGNSQAGIQGTDDLVFVIDVIDAM